MLLLACCLLFLGLCFLSLGMERHTRQIVGRSTAAPVRHLAKGLAWCLLVLSIAPVVQVYGLSIGLSMWFGLLSVMALVVGLTLSYRSSLLGLCGMSAFLNLSERLLTGPASSSGQNN